MRKKLLILPIIFISTIALAQDFAPSQQAQGYLDSKNITVDHSTGLFHYKVPIYTLRSGDFEVPITLDYVGRGVRIDDPAGPYGTNWNLNVGGIITRTVRGSNADEYGAAYTSRDNYPDADDIFMVNERKADGESDIFTAVFNGRSVNFILNENTEGKLIAEPLEMTGVRIECEHYTGYLKGIIGWIVTDEEGNKYYFSKKETSSEIVKVDATTGNGENGKSYTSSWHITRIEPRNRQPIIYNYKYGSRQERYTFNYESEYTYGLPMTERPLDFRSIQYDFRRYIEEAERHIMDYNNSAIAQLRKEVDEMASMGIYAYHPIVSIVQQNMVAQQRILGQLCDMSRIGQITSECVSTLDRLIRAYESTVYRAAEEFRKARYILIQCAEKRIQITKREISGGTTLKMYTPELASIVCDGKVVRFLNSNEITVEDQSGKDIITIKHTPSQVSFLGKDGKEYKRIKFEYFERDDNVEYIGDAFGFLRKDKPEISDFKYKMSTDPESNKIGSLSKITVSGSGEISLDYELNTECLSRFYYGGIRIKSMILKDYSSGTVDTVRYHYPLHGVPVCRNSNNHDNVFYESLDGRPAFEDVIRHSRWINKGNAFLNTGNTGLVYNYVEEEFVGKGKKTYLFFFPYSVCKVLPEPYKFWLIGLPLGTATYDKDGDLKTLTKYKYYADMDPFDTWAPFSIDYRREDWFAPAPEPVKFNRSKYQIRAYEYYIKENIALESFNGQTIEIYPGGYINDRIDIFVPNIKPRMKPTLPEQSWEMIYGGKVLSRQQEDYQLEKGYSTMSSVDHFSARDLGEPINKVEYFYDNLNNSLEPTRINSTDSKGDIRTTAFTHVCDMDTGGTLSLMKDQNIISPVVKLRTLRNNRLIEEKVTVYESFGQGDRQFFAPSSVKAYYPVSPVPVATRPALDGELFTYGEENYITENYVEYVHRDMSYQPTYSIEKGDTVSLLYDFDLNLPILKATGYETSTWPSTTYGSNANWMTSVNLDHSDLELKQTQFSVMVKNRNMKLYLVSRGIPDTTTYNVRSVGPLGYSSSGSIRTVDKPYWNLQVFDINTTGHENKDVFFEVSLQTLSMRTAYIALVPEDCEFEATGYNPDGTVFCKFDHTGVMERYEYDGVGRVTKVFDGDGYLIKENYYNNTL